MIIIKIPLRPISLNQLHRVNKYGHVYKVREARAWQELARKIIAEQYNEQILEGNVAVTLKICLKGDKPIDLDNSLKLCIDALQGTVIKNDNQVVGISAYRKLNSEADQITITIQEIDY